MLVTISAGSAGVATVTVVAGAIKLAAGELSRTLLTVRVSVEAGGCAVVVR